jgi:hypothetical protein
MSLFVTGPSQPDASLHRRQATLQSFGVYPKNGLPVDPLPSSVALGLFNPDPLLDVARYADGKIQVSQNLGNGMFELVGERRVSGEVKNMKWKKERMWSETILDQFSWGELHIFFENGTEQTITRVAPTTRRDLVPKDGQAGSFAATRKLMLLR